MSKKIESVLHESRHFPPPAEFAAKSRLGDPAEYAAMYARSIEDPEGFFAEVASELHWFEPWHTVREWTHPHVKWFTGGKTNLAYNCLDRHLDGWRRNKAALVWEGDRKSVV